MTLRVLHIITHLALGGATKNLLTLCRLSDPDVISPALLCGASSPLEATLEQSAERDGTPIHRLPSLGRPIRPLADHRAYRDLVVWLRANPVHVVHTHGSKAGVLGRLAAAAAGVPVIVHTVHGWGHHDHQRKVVRHAYVAAERRAAQVTDRLIVVADTDRVRGLADGIGAPWQYQTVRPGIDIARFRDVDIDPLAVRQELGIPPGVPVIGTVSRMAPQKAPDDFVRMTAFIHAGRPDAHFVFIGGGPLSAQITDAVRQASLCDCVHLLDYRDDVPQLLRAMDIFVLNSLWEGLPAVFAQAMCAALPIVATRAGGAAEAVIEGKNGLLVPPGAPRQQADAVLALLDDPVRRRAMGARGLKMADPRFSETHMAQETAQIYLTLAREKGLSVSPLPTLIKTRNAAQETVTL